MTDNFSNYPRSIGELKSERSDKASDWTPRDVLIDVLRDIDNGKLDLDALVVVMRQRAASGVGFRVSSPNGLTTLGMLTSAIYKLQD